MYTTENSAPAVADPERQFVGCLLCLPIEPARVVLTEMRASDVAKPTCGYVLQLVIELVAQGTPPAPVAVYSHAVATGRARDEHDRHRLSLWLADTYEAAQLPLLAAHLKTVVLEAAWRRQVRAHARRLLQAVEHSSTDVLAELIADDSGSDELWARYEASRRDDVPMPRTPNDTETALAPRPTLTAVDATPGGQQ